MKKWLMALMLALVPLGASGQGYTPAPGVKAQDEGTTLGQALVYNFTGTGVTCTWSAPVVTCNVTSGGGSGDVVGPASSTDNALVRFDGTTGKLVQDSYVTLADTNGAMTFAQGSLTGASTPWLSHTATWNNGATNFVGFDSAITSTAVANPSYPMQIMVNGTEVALRVMWDGSNSGIYGGSLWTKGGARFNDNGLQPGSVDSESPAVYIEGSVAPGLSFAQNARGIRWSASNNAENALDIGLTRFDTNVLKVTDASTGYRGLRVGGTDALEIMDSAEDHVYTIARSNLAADRTLTLPLLTGAGTSAAFVSGGTSNTVPKSTTNAGLLTDSTITDNGTVVTINTTTAVRATAASAGPALNVAATMTGAAASIYGAQFNITGPAAPSTGLYYGNRVALTDNGSDSGNASIGSFVTNTYDITAGDLELETASAPTFGGIYGTGNTSSASTPVFGVYGSADLGGAGTVTGIGVVGKAHGNSGAFTTIGGLFVGRSGTTRNIGLAALLAGSTSDTAGLSTIPSTDTALVVDNGTVAGDIVNFRDNGTSMLRMLDGGSLLFAGGYIDSPEAAAPGTPAAGFVRLYAKNSATAEFCSKDDAGTETCMSSGSGGSGLDHPAVMMRVSYGGF